MDSFGFHALVILSLVGIAEAVLAGTAPRDTERQRRWNDVNRNVLGLYALLLLCVALFG